MRYLLLYSAVLVLGLSGCGKTPPATPEAQTPQTEAESKHPPLIEQASRFGLAARLPQDTPFFVGTVGLDTHLTALKASRYWKEVIAYADDKAPASTSDLPTSMEDLTDFPLEEFSLAFGADSGPAIQSLIQLRALYTELTYYGMMAGSSASLLSGSPKPDDIIGDILSMPGLLDRVSAWATDFQFPTVILGAKLKNGDETLQSLRRFLESSEDLRSARSSTLTTPRGETLEIREWKLDTWLTQKRIDDAIASLPEDNTTVTADDIERLRTILVEKTICLAFGIVSDHVVLVAAPDRSSIQFVSDPNESLLARADTQTVAEPVIEKNLAGLVLWSGPFLQQLIDTQPSKPILEGALNGLRSNEMFAPMVDAIADKAATFAAAEAVYHRRNYDEGAAVFWWDKGLHSQTIGGANTKDWSLSKPLQFEPLLDTPGLVFGFNGHSDPSTKGRLYFESGMVLIHAAAQQALTAGLAGETFGQIGAMVDAEVIPQIEQAYDASKTLYTKALDSESAFIVELGGQMPMVWGMTEVPKDKPMLRLAAVHDVRNRALLSQSWLRIETALGSALTKIPSPIPLSMSQPMQSERFGVSTYHQPPLFDSPDLLPSASVNDDIYILGSSKSLNEELAFQIKENAETAANSGLRLRLDFKNLRKLLETASSFASEDSAATTTEATQLWAAPFGRLDATFTEENDRVRGQIDWSIRDMLDYD